MGDKRSTKVLVLLPGYQLFGQERALIGLAKLLRPQGVECSFLLHGDWGQMIARWLDQERFVYFMLPMGTLWSFRMALRAPWLPIRNMWRSVVCSLALRRILAAGGYSNVIIGNSTFALYLLPALATTEISVIFRHGDEPTTHSWFHRLVNLSLFSRANRHVVNCEFIARRLVAQFPRANPKVIYNTPVQRIDGDNGAGDADTLDTAKPGGAKRLLFVGQMAEHKGILLLVETFELLAAEFPDIVLDLVGDIPGVGECRPKNIFAAITHLLEKYPDRVFHHGYRDDVAVFYRRAHIHVCPSIWQEPSPNVVQDAKQYGLPSVVFDVGGVPELVSHGEDGYVCLQPTTAALAEGIRYFLADPDRLQRAGKLARHSIETRFGNQRFIGEWMEVLGLAPSEGCHG